MAGHLSKESDGMCTVYSHGAITGGEPLAARHSEPFTLQAMHS